MSGNFTDTTDRALLNYVTGTPLGGWTPPATTYLMLLTSNPSSVAAIPTDPTIAELPEMVATGYSRKAVTWASSTTPSGGISQIANNAVVTFGPFTDVAGSGNPATHGALVDVASGTVGKVISVWQWDTPVVAPQNQSITIPVGNLTITQQ